jgi:hypothetical protein
MRPTTLANPARSVRPTLTSLEPWQRDALETLRRELGLDGDAVIRSGLTLMLGLLAQPEKLRGLFSGDEARGK